MCDRCGRKLGITERGLTCPKCGPRCGILTAQLALAVYKQLEGRLGEGFSNSEGGNHMNQITDTLPPDIDDLLHDIAGYLGIFDYIDIMRLGDKYTADDPEAKLIVQHLAQFVHRNEFSLVELSWIKHLVKGIDNETLQWFTNVGSEYKHICETAGAILDLRSGSC